MQITLDNGKTVNVPDNWTEGLSKTQRYICLGNALTPSVVTEILNRLYEE